MDRADQIIEIGAVPGSRDIPPLELPLQIGVKAVLDLVVAPWRYTERKGQCIESYRV